MQSVAKVPHSCQMELRLTLWKHAGVLLPDLQHGAQCADSQSMQWRHVTRLQYRTARIECLAGLSHILILSVLKDLPFCAFVCITMVRSTYHASMLQEDAVKKGPIHSKQLSCVKLPGPDRPSTDTAEMFILDVCRTTQGVSSITSSCICTVPMTV